MHEIIDDKITGKYFHAYLDRPEYNAMYYFSDYFLNYPDPEYYLQRFKNFINNSLVFSFKKNKLPTILVKKMNNQIE